MARITPPPSIVALVAVGTLLLAGLVTAHPAGVPPGYTRMLHDCADDYGAHGAAGAVEEPGHGLVALDVREATIDGTHMVLVRVTVDDQDPGDNSQSRETVMFETPRKAGTNMISTTVNTPRTGAGTTITYVEGVEPAHLQTGLAAYQDPADVDPGEDPEDNGRFGFELGYTYAQLQVQNGERLTSFGVDGFAKPPLASSYQDADVMPGWNSDNRDSCADGTSFDRDRDHYEAANGHQVSKSDWTVEESGGSGGDGGDGGNGGGAGGGNSAPLADFSLSAETATTADTIAFTDGSADSDGTIAEWLWDFGDGTTSTEQNPTHRYRDDGVYTVTLWVTDNDGAQSSVQKSISVSNRGPEARMELPRDAAAGTALSFRDASSDPDGSVAAWLWDFGDGQTSHTESPTHTYAEAGTYTITLTVTDDDGATHTTSETLEVAGDGSAEAPGLALPALLIAALGLVVAIGRRR